MRRTIFSSRRRRAVWLGTVLTLVVAGVAWGAMVATAMRVVNAVPYVVAAEPGLLSSVDLPLTIPKGAFVTG